MYDVLPCAILIKTFSASQYRSRFKIWKLKKPRKLKETSKLDGGEVTAQPLAARLAWMEMTSFGLSANDEHSESDYMRDELWQSEIDDSSFQAIVEEIGRNLSSFGTLEETERDLEADFSTFP